MGINNIAKIAATVAFLVFANLCYMQTCTAIGSILATNNTIKDGDTLVSGGGDFALGFFSPQNSTNRYVGIWYNKIGPEIIVWVANRDTPLAYSSGIITIDVNGDLVILDGRGGAIWSTNISTLAKIAHAELLYTGNLQLREVDSDNKTKRVLWESFNYPTDTHLPSMKLYVDPKRDDTGQRLTSWRSASDPSPGNFSMGIDPQKLPQIVIWDGADLRWRSGPWDGRAYLGIPAMASMTNLNGYNISKNSEGVIEVSYSYFNDSFYTRYVLDSLGMLNQFVWVKEKNLSYTFWSGPDNECDLYGRCGPNGRCSNSSSKICDCLKGFEPKYSGEWKSGNWSGGCVRSKQLECEKNGNGSWKGDWFLKMERIKVPDFADSLAGGSLKECGDNCQKSCSCVAYAYHTIIGCMIWGGDLVDIQQFANGGLDFYIRLPASEQGSLDFIDREMAHVAFLHAIRKKEMKIVIIVTVLGTTLSLLACIFLLWRRKAKQREHKENQNKKGKGMLHFNLHKRLKASNDSSDGNSTLNDNVQGAAAAELPLFGFSIVAIATNNFSDENKLGEGGFGPVYKGKLPGGQQIAVKRLSKSSGQGLEEFKNEVVLISRVQHRNLVRLLGCCTEREEKILVYEYMHNKSLDAFLFGSSTKEPLDWAKRFHIVEGIARGLLYLHRDSRLKIIHRDLKASNILLDEGLNPKISDFGMARILGEEQILARTTRVVGTYGYMSPEYAMQGSFSEKSDVFSFGVLLLEIVSGKRNTSFYQNENTSNLLCLAWQLWNEGTAIELIDPALGGHYEQEQVQRCIHLGLLCVQESPKDRPSMSSVVFMLSCDISTLPAPKHPAFTGISPLQSDSSKRNHENFSVNDVTMTDIIFLGR
ncbi:G-type lectin S-receptor-like serine/threonine-protein kinase [Cinnamomum micranthum f. kanehirae]|uniref:Receptor-like serine/threonine-protein kinase n=1 Tax=Cinnamomum micranthum f. kanehirae TaxID=337451 RepID=A0A3S3MXK7_9MAGN|nr:G-type lectin S-receptor-like serine/threonine-protein kinase [Cinnamomum micranthum f. kanehirae]